MTDAISAAARAAAANPRALIGAAGAIAAASSLAIGALIAPWEGKRNAPYRDVAGIPTVCFGETQAPMRRYSDAECLAMLERRVGRDFAPRVASCSPRIVGRPRVFAAAISLSYNIGVDGYCRSTSARLFAAGDLPGGCRAMAAWNRARVKGRLVVVPGLVNRRAAEVQLCLSGAS